MCPIERYSLKSSTRSTCRSTARSAVPKSKSRFLNRNFTFARARWRWFNKLSRALQRQDRFRGKDKTVISSLKPRKASGGQKFIVAGVARLREPQFSQPEILRLRLRQEGTHRRSPNNHQTWLPVGPRRMFQPLRRSSASPDCRFVPAPRGVFDKHDGAA